MSLNCLKNIHTLLGHALGMVDAEMNTVFISIFVPHGVGPQPFLCFFTGPKTKTRLRDTPAHV